MPELPEVETIKNDLSRLIIGKKVVDITTDSPKQVKPSLVKVKNAVVGQTINKIDRRAKMLSVHFSNDKILAIHLKMTGQLLVRKKDMPKDKYQHVIFKLKSKSEKKNTYDTELRFADLRKFGWIKLVTSKELENAYQAFGPEPRVAKDFNGLVLTLKNFESVLAKTRRAIKLVIMDQSKVSGVGNIYACDALNLAQINPAKPANKLTRKETKLLFSAIEKVLKAGVKFRGASDQDYLDALGKKGKYQDHFLTYNREGKKCFNASCSRIGTKIKKIKIGARGTYYCPNCQK